MSTIYFDCFSGAAGDMILGALIDAGAPASEIQSQIATLGLPNLHLDVTSTSRGSLRATQVKVRVGEHDPARSYEDLVALIQGGMLGDRGKRRALKALRLLGEAEAKIHDVALEDIQLHELGSLDVLVDIVGSVTALEALDAERIVSSPVATGTGTISSAHGVLPLPAPAVGEIFATRHIPLFSRGSEELVTPTGAAILAAVCDDFGEIPTMVLRAVGYGAGSADRQVPNVVRVLVGDEETESQSREDDALLVEANLDDMSPELIPHVIDSLLAAGAQDAWITPITMKKGRPGMMLSVLARPVQRFHVFEIIFRETTTFGLRISPVRKETLAREWVQVDVEGMPVRVKIGRRAEDIVTLAPEHDDALAVAHATGLPLKEVYALALGHAAHAPPSPTN